MLIIWTFILTFIVSNLFNIYSNTDNFSYIKNYPLFFLNLKKFLILLKYN